jgi:hypothetical protein
MSRLTPSRIAFMHMQALVHFSIRHGHCIAAVQEGFFSSKPLPTTKARGPYTKPCVWPSLDTGLRWTMYNQATAAAVSALSCTYGANTYTQVCKGIVHLLLYSYLSPWENNLLIWSHTYLSPWENNLLIWSHTSHVYVICSGLGVLVYSTYTIHL